MDTQPDPTLGRAESLGYLINHLARMMEQALRGRIAEYDVVPGQFAQLLALYEADGLTQSELCGKVRIDQSTMAHTLKRMERDGLVHRVIDPTDRRRARIMLTGHAKELRPNLVRAGQEVNAMAVGDLTEAQIAEFRRTLAQLIGNLSRNDANGGSS